MVLSELNKLFLQQRRGEMKMTEWKPDTEFLDFLLTEVMDGDIFTEEGEQLSPEQMIEKMRAGKDYFSRDCYNIAYDQFKEIFQDYKTNNRG